MHDDFSAGGHDHSDGSSDALYLLDNVKLTTIGVDIGSSTYHLMFATVHLRRNTSGQSSRYEVVSREIVWRSEIKLTPYRGRWIDAEAIGRFVKDCHSVAGLAPSDIDSGAVILTGEALRQNNARELGEQIAQGSGKFVCVSAGHQLEAMLAAFGSGATAFSQDYAKRLMHIDIGGGTTKISYIDHGKVVACCAVMIGGRQISWDRDRKIVATTAGARSIARSVGVEIHPGLLLSEEDEKIFASAQAELITGLITKQHNSLEPKLRITRVLPRAFAPDVVSFSGGVSEYIYNRSTETYGDLGRSLGQAIQQRISDLQIEVIDPGEGIRSTVAGASQCSVQLSGNTVFVSNSDVLPLHNIPVVHPEIASPGMDQAYDSNDIAHSIGSAVEAMGLLSEEILALSIDFQGTPSFPRLSSLARGIQFAFKEPSNSPLIIMFSGDIARSIGNLLINELGIHRPIISLDGLDSSPLDYVDIGSILQPSGALPVVIKSLLFASNRDQIVI
jgi:ethanolamine utilization protein EutA